MLWWNEVKLLDIAFRVENSIDDVFVAKTQMLAAGKQLRIDEDDL